MLFRSLVIRLLQYICAMVFRATYWTLYCLSGDFIYQVSSLSPTKHFIIHSRKALLNGISPAKNRSIPPLKYVLVKIDSVVTWYIEFHVISLIFLKYRYEYFYALLRDFPDLTFTINGGITGVEEVNCCHYNYFYCIESYYSYQI